MPQRSHTLGRYPAVVVLGSDIDELASVRAFQHHVAEALGVEPQVRARDGCLLVPAPFEVEVDGRALPEEEHEAYCAAALAAAERVGATRIRYFIDHLYLLDWWAIDRATDAALDAAYAALPGWLGFDGARPRWFGTDEDVGPCLYGSMEPPGLQVSGVLELDTLRRWHRAFLRGTWALPYRTR